MVTETAVKLTYEDYANMPDDERYELIDGELIMAAAPNELHQRLITGLIRYFIIAADLGLGRAYVAPFDVVLSEYDVVQPDLLFVLRENAHIITAANVQGAPDLVVEILSPSTSRRDWNEKRDLYAKYGVKELWIADPDAREVWVMALRDGKYEVMGRYGDTQTFSSPTLAGVTIDLRDVFETRGGSSLTVEG